MNIKNVVVVGAGMMGNALAQVFASNPDLHVYLKTRALKEGRWVPIENNLDIMISRGAATEEELVSIEEYAVHADFHRSGSTVLILESPNGEKSEFDLTVERDTYTVTKR